MSILLCLRIWKNCIMRYNNICKQLMIKDSKNKRITIDRIIDWNFYWRKLSMNELHAIHRWYRYHGYLMFFVLKSRIIYNIQYLVFTFSNIPKTRSIYKTHLWFLYIKNHNIVWVGKFGCEIEIIRTGY